MKSISIRIILIVLFGMPFGILFSQSGVLRLLRSSKGFYLDHKVTPKQSLFSVGRIYSVHPHHLASYNGIDPNKGLQLDQVLRIPLSDSNFLRADGEGVPIYLTASTDDVISDLARFVGVEIKELQCWNGFSGTQIKKGSRWIVGLLLTNEMKEQQKKFNCSTPTPPSLTTAPAPQIPQVPQVSQTVSAPVSYFQSAYADQYKTANPTQTLDLNASIFKTRSGWSDGKHYVLVDNLVPGTVVKLINLVNQQVAYAKVLGEMARIKQNEGIDIRISEATAQFLGLPGNAKFTIRLNY